MSTTIEAIEEVEAEEAPRVIYSDPARKGERFVTKVTPDGPKIVIHGLARLGRFDSVSEAFDAWAAHDAERDFEPIVPIAI